VDTTLRDGMQSHGMRLTLEQKLRVAELLDQAGVYEIEAGVPASGKDACDAVYAIARTVKHAKVAAWNRLNESDIKQSFLCKPDILHICVPVSYLQIYTLLKKNKAWIVRQVNTCVGLARSRGYEVTVGFEDASRADISFMVSLASQLAGLGVARIRISDTVGVLVPSQTRRLVCDLREYTGLEIEMHAHNDLGMAVANSLEAAKGGADYVDTTLGGIGERAGNCCYHQFVGLAARIFQVNSSLFYAMLLEEQAADIMHQGI
jgi:Isopropylmalate/homocitrate/citramalate synthases